MSKSRLILQNKMILILHSHHEKLHNPYTALNQCVGNVICFWSFFSVYNSTDQAFKIPIRFSISNHNGIVFYDMHLAMTRQKHLFEFLKCLLHSKIIKKNFYYFSFQRKRNSFCSPEEYRGWTWCTDGQGWTTSLSEGQTRIWKWKASVTSV